MAGSNDGFLDGILLGSRDIMGEVLGTKEGTADGNLLGVADANAKGDEIWEDAV